MAAAPHARALHTDLRMRAPRGACSCPMSSLLLLPSSTDGTQVRSVPEPHTAPGESVGMLGALDH